MANINRINTGDLIRDKRLQYQRDIRRFQRECDHKSKSGPRLVSVHDEDRAGYIKDRNKLSDDAVICKECGEIFEMTAYQPDEIESAVSILKSTLNQIKVLVDLTDSEREDIVELIAWFDDKIEGSLVKYYLNMIKRLAGDDKRRHRDNGYQKGRVGNISGTMGISSKSFRN